MTSPGLPVGIDANRIPIAEYAMVDNTSPSISVTGSMIGICSMRVPRITANPDIPQPKITPAIIFPHKTEIRDNGADRNRSNVRNRRSIGIATGPILLDAQNTHLQAEQSAANAVYNFLLELMELERSIGRFTFFATKEQRQGWLNTLTTYIENKE